VRARILSAVRARVVVLVAALSLGMTACGGADGETHPPPPPPDRLVGEILEVREENGRVSEFTLAADGDRWEIGIAEDVDYGFDLDHLYEHRDTGDPVDVLLEERDGDLVALRIDDA
jgi:hypothetical protein